MQKMTSTESKKVEKRRVDHENGRKSACGKRLAFTPPPICLKPAQGLDFGLFKTSKYPICKGFGDLLEKTKNFSRVFYKTHIAKFINT